MDSELVIRHKLLNFLQSAALVLLLAGLMYYLALVIAGEFLAWLAFASVVVLFFGNPKITPQIILRMYNARPVSHLDAPQLHQLVSALTERAGLKQVPRLYYIPSRVINAFAMGSSYDSTIALSDGVLRKLSFEELAGILAHEITHVRNNDIRVMNFADITGRITKLLSFMGQFLLFVNLPLILFTDMQLNWLPLLVMVFAPLISDLVQLGLSRIREYDADLGSAVLLGDARPLASALAKMEQYQHNFLDSLFVPVPKIPEPSLLRTHPPTEERIRRLLEFHRSTSLHPFLPGQMLQGQNAANETLPLGFVVHHPRDPRRRMSGFWY